MNTQSGRIYNANECCRSCGNRSLERIMDYGEIPIADALLKEEDLGKEELVVPLTLVFCNNCSLVQVLEDVEPEILFCRNYPYFSSVSPALIKHFRESALSIIERKSLDSRSLVIEAASNDGYMLQNFHEAHIQVLGIEPAERQADIANKKGLKTINKFFSEELATQLRQENDYKADVFLGNNVLAHVPEPNSFVEGIGILLKPDGLAVIEVPYVGEMIEKLEFDTVFHQHYSYFSLTALDHLFRAHHLYINDIEELEIHGGSLRLFIQPFEEQVETVKSMLRREKDKGMHDFSYYKDYPEKINFLKKELLTLLNKLRKEGASIVGYGAAGKANTLLNYFGINESHLSFIADTSSYKQGFYFTGVNLPIVHPDTILKKQPDYVLILAWNHAKEILQQLKPYSEAGGKFILPLPEVCIVN